jgi:hypothetical protein
LYNLIPLYYHLKFAVGFVHSVIAIPIAIVAEIEDLRFQFDEYALLFSSPNHHAYDFDIHRIALAA